MSKKHFIALAKALKASKPRPVPTDKCGETHKLVFSKWMEQWEQDVKAVANVCGDCNNNFNWDTFMVACDFRQ